MALVIPEGRVKEAATVSGLNSYAIVGPAGPTFLGFSSEVGNGNQVDYVAVDQSLTEFELARGTVTAGSPTTLSRTTIWKSTSGNAKVNWPASTAVFVFPVIRGSIVKRGEYDLDGEALSLSETGQCSLVESSSTPEQIRVTIAQTLAQIWRLTGGVPDLAVYWDGPGAALGPILSLFRDNTPAASNIIGEIRLDGNNAELSRVTYGRIRARVLDPATGLHDGRITVSVPHDGVLQDSMEFTQGANGETYIQVRWNTTNTAAGPILALWKDAPATVDQEIGRIDLRGENSNSEQVAYSRIQGRILDPAAGAEEGQVDFLNMIDGALDEVMRIRGSSVLVGKSSSLIALTGAEMAMTGRIRSTVDGNTCVELNRLSTDGKLITFRRDDTEVGDISVLSGTVSLTGFTGAHAAQWGQGHEPDHEPPIGTLLSAIDEAMPGELSLHPKVRITSYSADRRIYGVYAGLKEESGRLQVWASGVGAARVIGPATNGDLLCSSATSGVAQRQPDDIVRSSTLGKVTRGDNRTDERLVPCTLKSG